MDIICVFPHVAAFCFAHLKTVLLWVGVSVYMYICVRVCVPLNILPCNVRPHLRPLNPRSWTTVLHQNTQFVAVWCFRPSDMDFLRIF